MPPVRLGLDGNPFDGTNGAMPWWVKAIPTIGVPSLIALGLSWFLVEEVRANLASVRAQLTAHATQMSNDQTAQQIRDRDLIYMFRQVCFNTARTDAQRDSCRTGP